MLSQACSSSFGSPSATALSARSAPIAAIRSADVDGSYALPSAWNDRISSFQGFGNCETKLYQNGDFTGSTYGPVFATDYVGATMNDEASSLRVY